MLGVAWLLFRSRNRFQMDGVVHGAAAGMGFAAFENLIYSLTIGSISVDQLLSMLWLRAILSPFGHGTWTAIICAALWRAKGGGRPRLDRFVAAAFAFSVLLHGLWDWAPIEGTLLIGWFVGLGVVGLLVLQTILERAGREEATAVVALNPDAARHAGAALHLRCRACDQSAPPGTRYCARCGAALHAPQPDEPVIRSARD